MRGNLAEIVYNLLPLRGSTGGYSLGDQDFFWLQRELELIWVLLSVLIRGLQVMCLIIMVFKAENDLKLCKHLTIYRDIVSHDMLSASYMQNS